MSDDSDYDPNFIESSSSSSSDEETSNLGGKRVATSTKGAPLAKKASNFISAVEPEQQSSKEVRVYLDPPEERPKADTDVDSGEKISHGLLFCTLLTHF